MANFTPQEIEEFLREFFDVVGARQYIGARYVPIFGRKDETSIIWDNSAPYEPLTIVLYQGNSYTSRQYVPEGVDILNTDFWANTGNYNAQVEQYRRDVLSVSNALPINDFDPVNTVKKYIDDNIASSGDEIKSLLPASAFSDESTVKQYVDKRTNLIATPEMYGAKGDGVTDDTDAFIACFATEKYINFENGKTYVLTEKITSSEVKHVNGNGSTILNLSGYANHTVDYIFDFNTDVIIEGINFDSNSQSRGSIVITDHKCFIRNCTFTGYSLLYGYYRADSQIHANNCDCMISNCQFINNGYDYGSASATLNRCVTADNTNSRLVLSNCIFDTVCQAIVCAGICATITDCVFTKVADNVVYDFTEMLIFANNNAYDCDDEIVVTEKNAIVSNCYVADCGNSFISINGNIDTLNIVNNTVITSSGFVVTRDNAFTVTTINITNNMLISEAINYKIVLPVVALIKINDNIFNGTVSAQASSNFIICASVYNGSICSNMFNITGGNLNITLNNTNDITVDGNTMTGNTVRLPQSNLMHGTQFSQSGVGSMLLNGTPAIFGTNKETPDFAAPRGSICSTHSGKLFVLAANWTQIGA